MKNKYAILLTILLVSGVFSNCSKKSSGPSFTYTVNGLTDVTVRQYVDTMIVVPVAVAYESGTQEVVTLTPENLPSGITDSPSTVSGTPSYTTIFYLNSYMKTAGTYPINILSSSASGNKTFSFNVIVSPNSNCGTSLSGTYTSVTTCNSYSGYGTGTYTNQDVKVTDSANQVILPTQFAGFTADINCGAGTFTTAAINNADFVIPTTSGTFGLNTITLNYTLSGSVNSTCTTTFTR